MAVIVAVIALAGAAVAVTVRQLGHRSSSHTGAGRLAGLSSEAACTRQVHVVTAASFVPVLNRVSGSLASGSNCVVIKTTVADGQGAAYVVASSPDADVWIPDDASWRHLPNGAKLSGTAGSVIATSPMYFVTVKNAPLPAAESSWVGLAAVLSRQTGTRLVIRSPAASADGLVAAGSMGDAVFALSGPLQSALDLMRAWQKGRMVTGSAPAFPQTSSEVAVVPEYALLRSGRADEYNVTAPTDATGMMRFTWNPTAAAASDPNRAGALNALHDALTGPDSALRWPRMICAGPPQPSASERARHRQRLPAQHGKSLATLSQHHVWHVLTTAPDQRRANILVVVDVPPRRATPPRVATCRSSGRPAGVTQLSHAVAADLPSRAVEIRLPPEPAQRLPGTRTHGGARTWPAAKVRYGDGATHRPDHRHGPI
jgi:hypothetical protein